jgi:hypothetical protein
MNKQHACSECGKIHSPALENFGALWFLVLIVVASFSMPILIGLGFIKLIYG